MKIENTKTVLFVTGCFVSHSGWDRWKDHFESRGYTTIAPPWPFKDASPAELRKRQPDRDIASIRLAQLTEHFATLIKALPERPILIGHSMGGLLVQLLVNRNLAAAGIAIHSVPPQGILTFKGSFYRATWGPLGIFSNPSKSFLMSFRQWQFAFTNGMTTDQQRKSYDESVIPESKLISRDALTKAAKVDFTKPHVPLLIMSGSDDNIMPASLNYSNYEAYEQDGSITDYIEFQGRNHYVTGQPTWKENADYILNWIADKR